MMILTLSFNLLTPCTGLHSNFTNSSQNTYIKLMKSFDFFLFSNIDTTTRKCMTKKCIIMIPLWVKEGFY